MAADIERLLFFAADMQELTEIDDELTQLIRSVGDASDELDAEELELIAAAGRPNYNDFEEKIKKL